MHLIDWLILAGLALLIAVSFLLRHRGRKNGCSCCSGCCGGGCRSSEKRGTSACKFPEK